MHSPVLFTLQNHWCTQILLEANEQESDLTLCTNIAKVYIAIANKGHSTGYFLHIYQAKYRN